MNKLKFENTNDKNSKKTKGKAEKGKLDKNNKKQSQKEKPQKQDKKTENKKRLKAQAKTEKSLKTNKKEKAQLTPQVKNEKTPKKVDKVLKIGFLGGVGEIGKNMTVIEYGKDIIVIDAGLSFPEGNMPGVDLVIPDVSYLVQNANRVRAIIVTHGHEDHIGGLPYVLNDLNVPVFGTKLTLTLIENKLKEHKVNAILNCIKAGEVIKIGCFSIECINVNHSIAGALGFSITTPVGVIFHSGDFKIDFTPVSGEIADLNRISEIGKKGVLLLMADSTNIEREGTTMSESVVKETLDHVFNDNATRRIIVATFASNVHRLQQILDLAVKYKRKVAFSGRSMINIAEAASKIGELSIPDKLLVDIEKIKNFKDHEILIVSTGTQGEPMSALTRMASGEFNKVTINNNDTVIISASVIPGNEKMIYSVINNLYKLGANVIYESLEPIHVSGHACKGELRVLHTLLKPKFFLPVHGEYRHLKMHVDLAHSLGTKPTHTLIAEIGDTVELTSATMHLGEKIPAGSRFVDGTDVDSADSFVLRDRVRLSEDGIIAVGVTFDQFTFKVKSLELVARGIAVGQELIDDAKANLVNTLKQKDLRKIEDYAELESVVKRIVKNYIYKATKKFPIIVPLVMVV